MKKYILLGLLGMLLAGSRLCSFRVFRGSGDSDTHLRRWKICDRPRLLGSLLDDRPAQSHDSLPDPRRIT